MLKRGMKPEHPGEILKEMYIAPLGLSQVAVAENIGVTRKTLSMLLNGHQGISAEMALRLSKAFGTSPDFWLNLQRQHDLWIAKQHVKLTSIRRFNVRNRKQLGKTDTRKQQAA
jgi:addiction module HigA family antidote